MPKITVVIPAALWESKTNLIRSMGLSRDNFFGLCLENLDKIDLKLDYPDKKDGKVCSIALSQKQYDIMITFCARHALTRQQFYLSFLNAFSKEKIKEIFNYF
jgi:hypothetical protein